MSSHNRAVSSDELLARQLSSGLDQQNAAGHEGAFTNPGSLEANGWRYALFMPCLCLVALRCILLDCFVLDTTGLGSDWVL